MNIGGIPATNVAALKRKGVDARLLMFRPPKLRSDRPDIVLNTPDGVWVSSENGVAIDNWQPELSKIPGVRRYADFYGREVVLNSNTLEDSIDQYDSMVKEKTVADPSPRDPRFLNIFPSSEMGRLRRHWPVFPTFPQDRLEYGEIVT